MKERDLSAAIIKLLRKEGFYAVKIHGGAFQCVGLPDILAVREGRAYFFEVKLPGNKPTRIQEHVIGELRNAGALAIVVTSLAEVREFLSDITQLETGG